MRIARPSRPSIRNTVAARHSRTRMHRARRSQAEPVEIARQQGQRATRSPRQKTLPRFARPPSRPSLLAPAHESGLAAKSCQSVRRALPRDRSPLRRRILFDQGDQGVSECLDIVGIAAGDDIAVGDRRLVDHIRAGVAQVGADRRPARRGAAPQRDRLRPAARGRGRSRAIGFPCVGEVADQLRSRRAFIRS